MTIASEARCAGHYHRHLGGDTTDPTATMVFSCCKSWSLIFVIMDSMTHAKRLLDAAGTTLEVHGCHYDVRTRCLVKLPAPIHRPVRQRTRRTGS